MAFDGYVDFGSDVPGEVPDGHRNAKQIKMIDYAFGVTNGINMANGTSGATAGSANQELFHFEKQIDKATPKLFAYCCQPKDKKPFAEVTALIYSGANDTEPLLKYKFTNVILAKVKQTKEGDWPTEVVEFAYDKVVITYKNPDNVESTLDFSKATYS